MKSIIFKSASRAFPYTLPVMAGYLFMGTAFGVLLSNIGYTPIWAFFMSIFIYAGSMQFVAIGLLSNATGILTVAIMTFLVNARHLFYGLSLLELFKPLKKTKPYMIFSLTDETFSLFGSIKPPEDVDRKWFYFFIAILNHSYWITGSVSGAILGSALTLNFQGLDFVMTALFVVMFLEQWLTSKKHTSALVGLFATLLSLLIFGRDSFMIPSMIGIFVILSVMTKAPNGGEKI